jgi:hypothetical protein
MKTLMIGGLLTASILVAAQQKTATTSIDPVVRWNRLVTDASAAAGTDPLTESRVLAIAHGAIHDAVNAIDPRYQSCMSPLAPASGGSIDAAIAEAAHDVLVELLPATKSTLDPALDETLRALGKSEAASLGVETGKRAARAMLAARADDGSKSTVEHRVGTRPGDYQPTPPDFTPAWATQWGMVKPFVLETPAQFRPGPPPAVDSALAHRDVETLRRIGGQTGSERNEEQSQIARFWYENTPQGWNRIAREIATSRTADAVESARLFAQLNFAIADGYIAVLEAKYHYDYWRPVTAIRAGGASEWLSNLGTPPIPDYPSGHAAAGNAAATVLARFYGSDYVAFTTTSGAPFAGITRKFWSFSQAARENCASRVLAGIHFPTAVDVGYRLGEDVGTWVCEHSLQPVAKKLGSEVGSGTAQR